MKAVIPAAGAGIYLRPLTYTQPKSLIPIAGKPIISHIIDQLAQCGIQEFVIVIGYLGEKIQSYLTETYPQFHFDFITQKERLGLGHAIHTASDVLKDEQEVVILLGDTILELDMEGFLHQEFSAFGISRVKDPRNFGVVEVDEAGFVTDLVEKPAIPKSNLALTGLYLIKELPALLKCLESNIREEKRTGGSFHLTDGLARMIHEGARFRTVDVDNWFDCGKKEILLETNARLLDRTEHSLEGFIQDENCIILPPVAIGRNCTLKNCVIGPHVTLGESVKISHAIIKDSIIGSFTALEDVVLHHSVVGSDTLIKGKSHSLNIGDNTELDLS